MSTPTEAQSQKTLKCVTTVTIVETSIWPNHYGDATLDEAIAYERDMEHADKVMAATEALSALSEDQVSIVRTVRVVE